MKLTKAILDLINNPIKRTAVAAKLGTGEQNIAAQMRANKPNGRLTKKDAVMAMSEISGLPEEEILEETAQAVKG